jgi:hypothetical protein
MKKLSCFLMILAMAVPAFAAGDIQVTATNNEDGTCTISYVATGAAPVGIGVDVDVTSGGPITAVSGMDPFFEIYLDAAYSLETGTPGSYTYGAGTPIALQEVAGETTLAADGASFALSMGGLGGETAPLDPAPMSGVIAVLSADVNTTGTVNLNGPRGGIVDVNGEAMTGNLGTIDVPVPLAFTITVEGVCFKEGDTDSSGHVITAADVAQWDAAGNPDCWCYTCFGSGDGSGDCVNTTVDLFKVIAGASFAPYGDGCGDFNYDGVHTTVDLFKVICGAEFCVCPVSCDPI